MEQENHPTDDNQNLDTTANNFISGERSVDDDKKPRWSNMCENDVGLNETGEYSNMPSLIEFVDPPEPDMSNVIVYCEDSLEPSMPSLYESPNPGRSVSLISVSDSYWEDLYVLQNSDGEPYVISETDLDEEENNHLLALPSEHNPGPRLLMEKNDHIPKSQGIARQRIKSVRSSDEINLKPNAHNSQTNTEGVYQSSNTMTNQWKPSPPYASSSMITDRDLACLKRKKLRDNIYNDLHQSNEPEQEELLIVSGKTAPSLIFETIQDASSSHPGKDVSLAITNPQETVPLSDTTYLTCAKMVDDLKSPELLKQECSSSQQKCKNDLLCETSKTDEECEIIKNPACSTPSKEIQGKQDISTKLEPPCDSLPNENVPDEKHSLLKCQTHHEIQVVIGHHVPDHHQISHSTETFDDEYIIHAVDVSPHSDNEYLTNIPLQDIQTAQEPTSGTNNVHNTSLCDNEVELCCELEDEAREIPEISHRGLEEKLDTSNSTSNDSTSASKDMTHFSVTSSSDDTSTDESDESNISEEFAALAIPSSKNQIDKKASILIHDPEAQNLLKDDDLSSNGRSPDKCEVFCKFCQGSIIGRLSAEGFCENCVKGCENIGEFIHAQAYADSPQESDFGADTVMLKPENNYHDDLDIINITTESENNSIINSDGISKKSIIVTADTQENSNEIIKHCEKDSSNNFIPQYLMKASNEKDSNAEPAVSHEQTVTSDNNHFSDQNVFRIETDGQHKSSNGNINKFDDMNLLNYDDFESSTTLSHDSESSSTEEDFKQDSSKDTSVKDNSLIPTCENVDENELNVEIEATPKMPDTTFPPADDFKTIQTENASTSQTQIVIPEPTDLITEASLPNHEHEICQLENVNERISVSEVITIEEAIKSSMNKDALSMDPVEYVSPDLELCQENSITDSALSGVALDNAQDSESSSTEQVLKHDSYKDTPLEDDSFIPTLRNVEEKERNVVIDTTLNTPDTRFPPADDLKTIQTENTNSSRIPITIPEQTDLITDAPLPNHKHEKGQVENVNERISVSDFIQIEEALKSSMNTSALSIDPVEDFSFDLEVCQENAITDSAQSDVALDNAQDLINSSMRPVMDEKIESTQLNEITNKSSPTVISESAPVSGSDIPLPEHKQEKFDIFNNGLLVKFLLYPGKTDLPLPQIGELAYIELDTYITETNELIGEESFIVTVGEGDVVAGIDACLRTMYPCETARLEVDSRYGYLDYMAQVNGITVPPNTHLTYIIRLKAVEPFPEFEPQNYHRLTSIIENKKIIGNGYFFSENYESAHFTYMNCLKHIKFVKPFKGLYIVLQNNLVACKMKLKLFGESVTVLESILKLDPNNEKALFRISECFENLGRNKEALAYAIQLQTIRPNSQNVSRVENLQKKVSGEQEVLNSFYKKMWTDSPEIESTTPEESFWSRSKIITLSICTLVFGFVAGVYYLHKK